MDLCKTRETGEPMQNNGHSVDISLKLGRV